MRGGRNSRLEVRPDGSRLDEDDFDPERLHLPAHRVAQGFGGMLGPGIGTIGRPGEFARKGADVDDAARSLPAHHRGDAVDHANDPEQVHVEHPRDLVDLDVLDRPPDRKARVVDEDVDPPVPVEDRPDGRIDRGLVGDIEGQHQGCPEAVERFGSRAVATTR